MLIVSSQNNLIVRKFSLWGSSLKCLIINGLYIIFFDPHPEDGKGKSVVLETQIQQLSMLVANLKNATSLKIRKMFLEEFPIVREALREVRFCLPTKKIEEEIACFSILAIGQGARLFHKNIPPSSRLIKTLVEIDHFYQTIGGIVGYHLKALCSLQTKSQLTELTHFSRAPGVDLTKPSAALKKSILAGLHALSTMGEIYPIGGLGIRLNLQTRTKEPLPAACLPFCGKTLLEGLIRDVQAREYFYYKMFASQVTVPIALMTSMEKGNHLHIESICKKKKWFGRGEKNFFLFQQLSVPVITEEGNWSTLAPGELNLHPGGHGALWRMADEKKVFQWLQDQGKDAILIRQINNPIAGVDNGLLALVGIGKLQNKAFGFASCERLVHAAEGVLVLVEKEGHQTISNIEYTDFDRFGILDQPADNGFSLYPANTNILYADLKQILPTIKKNPLPGLILNMKSKVPYWSSNGEKKEVPGGRLESMMQNIADSLLDPKGEPLRTFLTYNERKKTISTTKSSFELGKRLLETPEGAFYDLMNNGWELLKEHCMMKVPPFSSSEDYLKRGPSLLFLYHPALGPLYDVIGQKIKGGRISEGSELQLEITELMIQNLELTGSCVITATQPLGHYEDDLLQYSPVSGKCVLKNVKIHNQGINRSATKCYWKNAIRRHEAFHLTLQGNAEFHAEDVIFEGGFQLVVPSGERWVAYQTTTGEVAIDKEVIEEATWHWKYIYEENQILLMQEVMNEVVLTK